MLRMYFHYLSTHPTIIVNLCYYGCHLVCKILKKVNAFKRTIQGLLLVGPIESWPQIQVLDLRILFIHNNAAYLNHLPTLDVMSVSHFVPCCYTLSIIILK